MRYWPKNLSMAEVPDVKMAPLQPVWTVPDWKKVPLDKISRVLLSLNNTRHPYYHCGE